MVLGPLFKVTNYQIEVKSSLSVLTGEAVTIDGNFSRLIPGPTPKLDASEDRFC